MSRHHDEVAVERLLAGRMKVADSHEDDRDAAIVHLHVIDGLSAAEAAHRLKTNPVVTERVLAEHAARELRLSTLRSA